MGQKRDFKKDLENSNRPELRKSWEELIKKRFGDKTIIQWKDSIEVQRGLGTDTTITLPNGRRFSVELKTRVNYVYEQEWLMEICHRYYDESKDAYDTNGKWYYNYHRKLLPNIPAKDGWVYTTTAEYILHGTTDKTGLNIIEAVWYNITPFKTQVGILNKYKDRHLETPFPNSYQDTLNKLVPLEDIKKISPDFWYWNIRDNKFIEKNPEIFKCCGMELNKIYYQDCMMGLKDIADASVDCIIIDPPYGIKYHSNRYVHGNPHKPIENDDKLTIPMDELWRVLKPTGAMFIFHSHKVPLIDDRIKNIIVWNKNNHTAGDLEGDFGNKHELIAFMPKEQFVLRSKRYSNVWEFDKTDNKLHPTQKPVPLIHRILETSTKEGDIVLDCFMGSGTTAVACKQAGRNFIGFEIDKGYVDVANKRLQQQTMKIGQQTLW